MTGSEAPDSMAPADILIIDDNPGSIHLITQALLEAGHRVRVATHAKDADRLIGSQLPELLIMDVEMPDIDGYTLCADFRQRDELRNVPVIFVSVHDNPVDKVRAFEVGAVDYVNKPVHAAELINRVRTHVRLFRLNNRLREEVDAQTRELQDALTALRVLSRQQQDEAASTGKEILDGIRSNIMPLIERLGRSGLDESQQQLVDLIASGLNGITRSLASSQQLLSLYLSPVEIQVAHMVKEGKRSKEIARILNLSELTIATHRKNIRRKLGIRDRNISLFSYLSRL